MQLLITFTQIQNAFNIPEVYTYVVSSRVKYFVKKTKSKQNIFRLYNGLLQNTQLNS